MGSGEDGPKSYIGSTFLPGLHGLGSRIGCSTEAALAEYLSGVCNREILLAHMDAGTGDAKGDR